MSIYTLRREQWIARPLEEVFDFFSDAANLQLITPAWLSFQILTRPPIEMKTGTLLDYRLKWHGFPIAWRTKIVTWNPPRGFTDIQLRGPYRLWHHTHSFAAQEGGTRMVDLVNYELPLGFLGLVAHDLGVRRDLEGVFDYRARLIEERFPAPADQAASVAAAD
ncbi:MAG: SRPBCC family protein [Candidatus Solibacter sp.]